MYKMGKDFDGLKEEIWIYLTFKRIILATVGIVDHLGERIER